MYDNQKIFSGDSRIKIDKGLNLTLDKLCNKAFNI